MSMIEPAISPVIGNKCFLNMIVHAGRPVMDNKCFWNVFVHETNLTLIRRCKRIVVTAKASWSKIRLRTVVGFSRFLPNASQVSVWFLFVFNGLVLGESVPKVILLRHGMFTTVDRSASTEALFKLGRLWVLISSFHMERRINSRAQNVIFMWIVVSRGCFGHHEHDFVYPAFYP